MDCKNTIIKNSMISSREDRIEELKSFANTPIIEYILIRLIEDIISDFYNENSLNDKNFDEFTKNLRMFLITGEFSDNEQYYWDDNLISYVDSLFCVYNPILSFEESLIKCKINGALTMIAPIIQFKNCEIENNVNNDNTFNDDAINDYYKYSVNKFIEYSNIPKRYFNDYEFRFNFKFNAKDDDSKTSILKDYKYSLLKNKIKWFCQNSQSMSSLFETKH